MFTVFDEGQSWYLEDNIKTYTTDKKCEPSSRDEEFDKSNKMNSINGRIYGNLEGMRMKRGEKVNWYLLGLGTEVDMHTVHFHGQTVLAVSKRCVFRCLTTGASLLGGCGGCHPQKNFKKRENSGKLTENSVTSGNICGC